MNATTALPSDDASGSGQRRGIAAGIVAGGFALLGLAAVPALARLGVEVPGDVEITVRMAAAAITAITASAVMARTARRRQGADRWVWSLFAVGAFAWAAGAVLWVANLPLFGGFPTASPADVVFLLLPMSWAAAAVVRNDHVDGGRSHRSTRAVDAIDATIVGLSLLLLMSIPAFHLTGATLDDTTTLVTMLYPVTDAVVLTLIVRSISRNPTDRLPFSLIAVGVATFGLADVAYLNASQFSIDDRSLSDASWIAMAWIAAFAFLGVAAWTALPGAVMTPLRTRRRVTHSFPVVIGAVAAILALLDLTQDNGATWTTTTLVAIMTLLLTRQSMTLAENRRLSSDLVSRIRDLEHQASHDALTDLANREHLPERLRSLIDTADQQHCSAVLFLDIDLLKSVNDSLGHTIGDELIRAFVDAGLPCRGELWVAMLDTKAGWDELIRRHAPDAKLRETVLANPLYRNITGRFVNSHDYLAMEQLYDLHASGRYDLVIIDTPPSRNALDLLDAPGRMREFFGSRLLRWLTVPYRSRLFTLASKPFYQVADRVLGSRFLQDIAEFFILFQSMYDGFVERADAVQHLLASPSTSFVVVSTLEAAPAREARFFLDLLGERKLHVGALVLNKVLPDYLLDRGAATAARRMVAEADELAAGLTDVWGDLPYGRRILDEIGTSFVNYQLVAQREAELRSELSVGAGTVATVPYFSEDIGDLAGLLALGERLWR